MPTLLAATNAGVGAGARRIGGGGIARERASGSGSVPSRKDRSVHLLATGRVLIVLLALLVAAQSGAPGVAAQPDRGYEAVDPFDAIPEIGVSGEPLSLAELFISSVEVRARALPEQMQDTIIFLLTSLDNLPRTETTPRDFVTRTFTDDTATRDRAALLGIINQMEPEDVQAVFTIVEGAVNLLDILFLGMNRAVFNSVECNEEIPFEQFENTAAAASDLEIPELAYGVPEILAVQFATCEVWLAGRAPEIETRP